MYLQRLWLQSFKIPRTLKNPPEGWRQPPCAAIDPFFISIAQRSSFFSLFQEKPEKGNFLKIHIYTFMFQGDW